MKKFLRELIEDENKIVSSKRLSGLLSILSLILCLIVSTFICGTLVVSDVLVETIGLFAFGAFGLTSIDKFIKNKNNKV